MGPGPGATGGAADGFGGAVCERHGPSWPAPQRAGRRRQRHVSGGRLDRAWRGLELGPPVRQSGGRRRLGRAFPARWPVPGRSRARAAMRPRALRRARDPPRARAAPCLPAAPRQRSSAAAPNPRSTGPIPWWAPRWARARGPGWTSPAVARRRQNPAASGTGCGDADGADPGGGPAAEFRTVAPDGAASDGARSSGAASGPRRRRPSRPSAGGGASDGGAAGLSPGGGVAAVAAGGWPRARRPRWATASAPRARPAVDRRRRRPVRGPRWPHGRPNRRRRRRRCRRPRLLERGRPAQRRQRRRDRRGWRRGRRGRQVVERRLRRRRHEHRWVARGAGRRLLTTGDRERTSMSRGDCGAGVVAGPRCRVGAGAIEGPARGRRSPSDASSLSYRPASVTSRLLPIAAFF